MGYSVIFDILGSLVIGGVLMITAWRLSDAATEKTINNRGELSLQQSLVTVAQMVEFDFRKIGYCVDPKNLPAGSSASIPYADTSYIRFYTDIESDGNLDSITYYLGPLSECLNTPNPRDRILYRIVNNETPMPSNLGVTQFSLKYYDPQDQILSTPVTELGAISSMEINITVENVAAYDTSYSSAFWKQIRLASRNVNQR